ncbi:MAG: hypothetical protein GKR94_29825 [Gammaproteobacteria bacterium]|nr:hypothetical protein [Gammaproteobacteria bacterium]
MTTRDLDLNHSIRPGLDILANEIIIGLKKRTRFPRNREIYQPGLVQEHTQLSLLHYELHAMERVHAELGRYTYADQEPFTDVGGVAPVLARAAPPSPIQPMRSNVGSKVIAYYLNWVEVGCEEGTDADSFGETVTADVSALLAIMERVNLGKFVAESKFQEAPERFHTTGGDRAGLKALIVKKDRETKVYELARKLAQHYAFNAEQAVALFDFMIKTTVDIEINYLRQRLRQTKA